MHDIILWGASGFTGRLVAEYLTEQYSGQDSLNWAMAGRNQQKLSEIRDGLGDKAKAIPILTADSNDAESLDKLVAQGKVIISTVGPYAKYGSELVAACVRHGRAYCDLAGEVQWVRRMIDAHAGEAAKTGARIVHCCGFDSIPSDLGAYTFQNAAKERYGQPLVKLQMYVKAAKGGFSGGTFASMLNIMAEAKADRNVARMLRSPHTLNPPGTEGPEVKDMQSLKYDEKIGAWIAPFVMAGVNTRVVRRSAALQPELYGKQFAYNEAMITGKGLSGRLKGIGMMAGLGVVMVGGSTATGRKLLQNTILKSPGEGPSKEERETGFFKLNFIGETEKGEELTGFVSGDRDPGYGSTAKMLGETGVCLAKDELSVAGGFWTPASAMGQTLIDRLQANAGLKFVVD